MQKKANGEGSIYFSESRKRWIAQYTVNINGETKRKSCYGKTKKEAREKMIEAQMAITHGKYVEPAKTTVATLMKRLCDQDRELNIIKDSTYNRKIATYNRIKSDALGNIPIQQVTEDDLNSYMKSITSYSDSVIRKDFELLRRTMNEAVEIDLIIKNPMTRVRRPRSNQTREKVRALTLSEHQSLYKVLCEEKCNYSVQMRLMLLTGMRMGEINALDVNDVNFTFNTISVRRTLTRDSSDRYVIGTTTKTYAGQRKIPMSESAIALLKDYMDNDYVENREHLLFWDKKKNGVVTTNQVNCQLSRIIEKYNLKDDTIVGKISVHSLRHSYATRAIEAGMPAKVLQTLLGHTDIKITLNTYCDAFDEFKGENIVKVEQYLKDKKIVV